MRVHWFQHVPFEGLGVIGDWAKEKGYETACTRLHRGETPTPQGEYDFLIVMGGPMNIYDYGEYPWLKDEKKAIKSAIESGKKVLGICLGAQLIADVLGAEINGNGEKEIGWHKVKTLGEANNQILTDFPKEFPAFHWHGDTFSIPEGAFRLFKSRGCGNQGFIYAENVIGLQFHLESTRKNIEELIENCADEMDGGRHVQDAGQIREGYVHIPEINNLCLNLLDKLAAE